MSMNLKCVGVPLIQSPTHITYMCYYADMRDKSKRKSNWQTIRNKYLMWIRAQIPGEHTINEAFEARIKSHGKLDFYFQ